MQLTPSPTKRPRHHNKRGRERRVASGGGGDGDGAPEGRAPRPPPPPSDDSRSSRRSRRSARRSLHAASTGEHNSAGWRRVLLSGAAGLAKLPSLAFQLPDSILAGTVADDASSIGSADSLSSALSPGRALRLTQSALSVSIRNLSQVSASSFTLPASLKAGCAPNDGDVSDSSEADSEGDSESGAGVGVSEAKSGGVDGAGAANLFRALHASLQQQAPTPFELPPRLQHHADVVAARHRQKLRRHTQPGEGSEQGKAQGTVLGKALELLHHKPTQRRRNKTSTCDDTSGGTTNCDASFGQASSTKVAATAQQAQHRTDGLDMLGKHIRIRAGNMW